MMRESVSPPSGSAIGLANRRTEAGRLARELVATEPSADGVTLVLLDPGINRRGVEDERALLERISEPLGPEFCTAHREMRSEA
jgi:hypothetical protein